MMSVRERKFSPTMESSDLHTPTTMATATRSKSLHVAVFPWLAFGHIIPYFELAKYIAQRGHKVSFISTTRNIQRLPELPTHLIDFVTLTLPRLPQLPENAEATMDIPLKNMSYLKKAFDGLEPELTKFLEVSVPDWIIYDFAPHWLHTIAGRFGISRAFFFIMSPWFAGFFGPTSTMIETGDPAIGPDEMMFLPEWVEFPTKVAYRSYEVKMMVSGWEEINASGVKDWYRHGSVVSGCDVYVVRHCREFEPEWLTLLEKVCNKPVVPVGLMPPSFNETDKLNRSWLSINEWLHKQTNGSVVYVALGSEVPLSQHELTELALGLQLSGFPFFWALRGSTELPDGFEDRTRERGVVWNSWAPQLRILAHDSVGGFLTHCGWGSTIEGLQFGRPLIMLPFMLDQGLNARVLEDTGVGVEIERDEADGSYTKDSVAEAIKLVLGENEMGKHYGKRAKEMSAIFGDKNLQDGYVDKFIEYIEGHR